jgi:hypothetical protein
MTQFREVKTTADDLRVELEVNRQLDKDVSRAPVIEVEGERDTSINSSAAASMTDFREGKSADDDLRVKLEVKNQLDKDRTHTNSEVGGGENQLKNKWAVEFEVDETITIIELGSKKRAEAQAEIGAEEAIFIQISISKSASLTIGLQTLITTLGMWLQEVSDRYSWGPPLHLYRPFGYKEGSRLDG